MSQQGSETGRAAILRKPDVTKRTGLSQSTIYRLERKGDFPKRVQLSPLCVGWLEPEVEEWIRGRSEVRGVADA